MEAVESLGGKLIVMASRALARVAKSPADYQRVYDRILSRRCTSNAALKSRWIESSTSVPRMASARSSLARPGRGCRHYHIERQLQAHDISLSGYCRGGFYTASDAAGRQAALDDNHRAIDEAKELGAPCLVLVVGALPGALDGRALNKDLSRARNEVHDGIAASLDYARPVGLPLAIEPLHPMQAADRACINTLEQALDLCDQLDPQHSGQLGLALDI